MKTMLIRSKTPMPTRVLSCVILAAALPTLAGCAAMSRRDEEAEAKITQAHTQQIDALTAQNKQLQQALTDLNKKLDAMDLKSTAMNKELEDARGRLENLVSNQKAKPKAVTTPPGEGSGAPIGKVETGTSKTGVSESGPDAGFAADDAIQKYRKAMILFESHNYPDAILAFSGFVDQYPDHPLAGDAQFYLGRSYYKQGEYKLAIREYQRVMTSYDRSSHIADTLRDLADCAEKTGDAKAAKRYRQQLTSLFPNSPAATGDATAPGAEPESEAPKAQAPSAQAQESSHAEPAHGETAHGEAPQNAAPAAHENAPALETAPALDSPPPTAPINTGEEKHAE